MRTIYIDEVPVRVGSGCGLHSLNRCPVQVWANQNGMVHTMTRPVSWILKIFLWTKDASNKIIAQKGDSCYYSEAVKIKKQRSFR